MSCPRLHCSTLLVCFLIFFTTTSLGARGPWSYPYRDRSIDLEMAADAAALLLDERVANSVESVEAILAGESAFLPPVTGDRQAYRLLWLPRFVPGLSESERLQAIERLNRVEGVAAAAPVFPYGEAKMIPKRELLLIFEEDRASAEIDAFLSAEGLAFVREFPALRPTFLVSISGDPSEVFARCAELRYRPHVVDAHPNFILHLQPQAMTNDPLLGDQWDHNNTGQTGGTPGADIKTFAAWDFTTGSPDIKIAILDEGCDVDHEDLADNMLPGHDSTNQPSPEGIPGNASTDPHGTACAGIAAAVGDNSIGIAGIAYTSKIIPVRIGYGSHWTENSWIIDAVTWSADNGADILSNSWGGGAPTTAIEDAFIYAATTGRGGLGSVVFASSGNFNSGVIYPAAYDITIAVGATSPCDERKRPDSCDNDPTWGSCFGPELDLVAPAPLVTTTDLMGTPGYSDDNYTPDFSGTSSACPHAAGAAALILTVDPTLTPDEVEEILEQTADDMVGFPSEDTQGWDEYMGWGRINLEAVMALIGVMPPLDLACDLDGNGDVNLSWNNPMGYDSIEVSRDGTTIATLPGDATSYIDPLPPGSTTLYEVRGELGGIMSASISCAPTVSNPQNLACAFTPLHVELSWENTGDYSQIEIYRDGVLIETLPGSQISYQDEAIAQQQGTYDYSVLAVAGNFSAAPLQCTVDVPQNNNFIRADANHDGVVDVSDGIFSLTALFGQGAPQPVCADAGDSNDDGIFDISDVIYTLTYLFVQSAPPPPPPFPGCGVDLTLEDVPTGCDQYLWCSQP